MQFLATLFAPLSMPFFERMEAEGRLRRQSVLVTARCLAWIAVSAAVAVMGCAFLLYGVYLEGVARGQPSIGAFLAGALALLAAALVAWALGRAPARNHSRD